MRWERTCRFLGLAGVVAFATCTFTPVPNIVARWLGTPASLEKAEAIIVLGGGISPDGILRNASFRRAVHGIALHRKGLGSWLVLLGGERTGGVSEAGVRADLAREMGISTEVVLKEAGARTTREEAVRVEALLQPMNVRRTLLVTDSLHMARAKRLFEQVGFQVLAAPVDDFPNPANAPKDRLRLMGRILEELFARIYYKVAGHL